MKNKFFIIYILIKGNFCLSNELIFNYYDSLFSRLEKFKVNREDGFLFPSNDHFYNEQGYEISKNALAIQKRYSKYVTGNYFQKLALTRLYRKMNYLQMSDSLASEIMKSEFQLIKYIVTINNPDIYDDNQDELRQFHERNYPLHLINNTHVKILSEQFTDSIFNMKECKEIFLNCLSAKKYSLAPNENQIIKQIQISKNLSLDSATNLYLMNEVIFPWYKIKPMLFIDLHPDETLDTTVMYLNFRLSIYSRLAPYSLIIGSLGNKKNIKQLKKINDNYKKTWSEYLTLSFINRSVLLTDFDLAIAKLSSKRNKKYFLKKYFNLNLSESILSKTDASWLSRSDVLNRLCYLNHNVGYQAIITLSNNHKVYTSNATDGLDSEPLNFWLFFYAQDKLKGLKEFDYQNKKMSYYEETILKLYKSSGNKFISRNLINPNYDNFGNKY